jgi:hypothetical protein
VPFRGGSIKEMVSERFAHQATGCGGFQVEEIPVQKCEQRAADEAQQGLFRLTAAIVALSVLILVGTVIVAANG